jgi:hypothetical protein
VEFVAAARTSQQQVWFKLETCRCIAVGQLADWTMIVWEYMIMIMAPVGRRNPASMHRGRYHPSQSTDPSGPRLARFKVPKADPPARVPRILALHAIYLQPWV